MKRSPFKPLAIALVLAGLGQGLTTLPAQAGGQVSWSIAPSDRGAAEVFSTGMRLYSIARDLKGGNIDQRGLNNIAGLAQRGHGNFGLVQQRGNGHSGTLQQNGNDNSYALFQYGRNARDAVVQNGNGQAGATFSYGW